MKTILTQVLFTLLLPLALFSNTIEKDSTKLDTLVTVFATDNNYIVWEERTNNLLFFNRADTLSEFTVDSVNIAKYVSRRQTNQSYTSGYQYFNRRITRATPYSNNRVRYRFISVHNSTTGQREIQRRALYPKYSQRIYVPRALPFGINKTGPQRFENSIEVVLQDSNIIILSPNVHDYILMSKKGEVLAEEKIVIKKPFIYNFQERNFICDSKSDEIYLVTKTVYRYLIHHLNPETGETELLYDSEILWPEPNWKISGGVLSYTREEEEFSIDLAKK